jgi:hypothetical protein
MATRKVKRYNGMTDSDVRSFAGIPENESNAGMAEAADTGMSEKEPGWDTKEAPTKPAASKSGVVTKEQLAAFQAKHGADKTLRDYMNAQQNLTRRGESKPAASTTAASSAPKTEPAKPKSTYETPYDRMNRTNREAAAAKADTAEETRRLRNRVPPSGRGVINTRDIDQTTLLPKKMAKGGMTASRRADGIAMRGKTRGKIC